MTLLGYLRGHHRPDEASVPVMDGVGRMPPAVLAGAFDIGTDTGASQENSRLLLADRPHTGG